MKGFSPGKRGFDMAAEIFRAIQEARFTHADLTLAGVEMHPGNLTRLRNDGVLMHPKDESTAPTGRRRQHQHGPKTWMLTPDAVRTLKRYPEEVGA